MTPEEARDAARRLQDDHLVAEAASVAEGWRFLTVDGLAAEDQAGMDLYDQAVAVFREVVGTGRQGRHFGTSSGMTFGIRSGDAEQCIHDLRQRLEALNPPWATGGQRWTLRDGMR
jgi:predicted hotdog family 3-hydroxylacyl-ACP dehydratase